MAKPRVFVSSTYYDLKHLRSSIENFIESVGFEPVLSEKGDIAYSPDVPLDESCYREAQGADIFVLIIGGRYGSESSSTKEKPSSDFFERYDSITKQEYINAIENGVPTYILIETNVYAEYRTFLKNSTNKNISYAHVDSVNIFHLIQGVLAQPSNNPVFSFERYAQIESWLREQWAGLFKELLGRLTDAQQMASLNSKVSELGEINETLRRYMEAIISKVAPAGSEELIDAEGKRLQELQTENLLKNNPLVRHVTADSTMTFEEVIDAIRDSKTRTDCCERLANSAVKAGDLGKSIYLRLPLSDVLKNLNDARVILGLPAFED